MQPPRPPTAPAAQRQGPKHRQRVTGMRPPRHGGAAGAPAVPGTCSGTLGGHRALGRLHSGAAALPGWAVRSRAPAPDGGARLEGCHHPRAAPALPVWLWPQTARGLGLSFPTTEPHGGLCRGGEPAWQPVAGEPGPGGACAPASWARLARGQHAHSGGGTRPCREEVAPEAAPPVPGPPRGTSPHAPGAGQPAVRRCTCRGPVQVAPPHTYTHRAAPRPRTLTTTVMPLFSSGALS